MQMLVIEDGGFDPGAMGPLGAKALAGSPGLRKLRELRLRYGGIGDEGAAALADSPIVEKLRILEISVNGVVVPKRETTAASREIRALKRLQRAFASAWQGR